MNKDIPARRIFVFSILILLCVSFIQPLGTSSVFAQSAPPDFSRINPPWIPAALPAPVLSSPISGSYISDPTPDFTWSAVTGATEYELQISASSTFSPLKENPKNLSSTAYTSGTLIDGKYYWRVRTMTPSLGTWSSVRNFTVDTLAPAIPVLSAPTNNLTVKGTPTYSWKAALGATYYKFQHAKDTGFTSDVYTSADLKVLTHKPPLQQPGEYYWRVKAKDLAGNESDWSGYFKVTVEPTIPKAPVLTAPATGLYTNDKTPDFAWNGVDYGDHYQIQISKTSTFTAPVLIDQTLTPGVRVFTPGTDLTDAKYYWRVRAYNSNPVDSAHPGPWSSVRNFTVDTLAPAIPVLSAPTNNLTVKGTPTYSWKAALGATYYKFQHAKDTGFTSDVYTSADLKVLTHKPPLQQPGEYYWRVKAKDLAGNESDWSGYFKVTVEPTIPKAPVLTAPATGLYTNDKTPDFAWNGVDYGDHYQIQISKTSTFTAPVLIDQTLTPGVRVFTPGTDLTDAKYYWRVRAYNSNPVDSAHPGPWSSVRNFTVDTQKTLPPILNIPVTGATLKTRLPAFSVYSVSTAVRYQFQVTEGADFTSPRLDSIITSTSFITPNTSALSLGKIYSWRVRAYDAAGNISDWSLARTFELNNQNAPINNSFTTNTKPPFSWTTVYGALGYNLQVSTDPDFTDPHLVINQYPTSTSFTPATALPNGLYYWRIRVRTGSDWSTPEVNRYWKLTITPAAPPAPVLVSPTIGIVTSDTTPEFSWNAAAGADHYNIQVSLTNTFSSLITDENLSTGV